MRFAGILFLIALAFGANLHDDAYDHPDDFLNFEESQKAAMAAGPVESDGDSFAINPTKSPPLKVYTMGCHKGILMDCTEFDDYNLLRVEGVTLALARSNMLLILDVTLAAHLRCGKKRQLRRRRDEGNRLRR